VQRIGWILAVIFALGWLASEIPVQNAVSNDQPKVQTCWRRTIDGWENSSQWSFYAFTSRPTFHPIYLSAVLCIAVAWIVLVGYLTKSPANNNQNSIAQNIIHDSAAGKKPKRRNRKRKSQISLNCHPGHGEESL
jgi:hypothetical protein